MVQVAITKIKQHPEKYPENRKTNQMYKQICESRKVNKVYIKRVQERQFQIESKTNQINNIRGKQNGNKRKLLKNAIIVKRTRNSNEIQTKLNKNS